MSRKLLIILSSLTLTILLLITRAPVVEAKSSGCAAFAGIVQGFLQEATSKDTGVQAFSAGETIRISATVDGTSNPYSFITWYVTGNVGGTIIQSGSSLTFTIPTTQNYRIVVENVGGGLDANIAAACNPAGATGDPAPVWSGYSDGRLNPDPAEYYSIFCANGDLDIWVVFQGQGTQIIRIQPDPFLAILNIGQNRIFKDNFGNSMTVVRLSQDTFGFYGSNGNQPGVPGSKIISLNQCQPPIILPDTALPEGNDLRIEVQQIVEATLTPVPSPTPNLTDTDGDGVIDTEDLCPTRSYLALRAEFKLFGCRDMDKDGFVDPYDRDGTTYILNNSNPNAEVYIDDCPNEFGTINGCPLPQTVTVVDPIVIAPSPITDVLTIGSVAPVWDSVTLTMAEGGCEISGAEKPNSVSDNFLVVAVYSVEITTTRDVVLREEPSRTSEVAYEFRIPAGETITVIGTNENGSWVEVRYKTFYTGWIPSGAGSFNYPGWQTCVDITG